ncbi:MAG: Npt1/Npt2 family nucleotide transporter [Myxococcota bacterium]
MKETLRGFGRRIAALPKEERPATGLLALAIFLLMVCYYVLKTVREPWILTTGGAEQKTYASAWQAGALVLVLPIFNYFVARLDGRRMIVGLTLIFVANIELFYLGAISDVPGLGFIYFVWVGIFSLSSIALFWSFANDAVTTERGERMFPFVTVGMTAGPVVGSKVGSWLFDAGLSYPNVLQVGAAILLVHLGVYLAVFRQPVIEASKPEKQEGSTLARALRGFQLVLARPYIRRIALLILLLNVANTTGEFILSKLVEERAAGTDDPGAYIGSFYGDFYFGVNLLGVLLQVFVASSLVRRFGIKSLLYTLPLIALVNYSLVAFGVAFSVFRVIKTAENASDYSLMNNAKAMLWLRTSREEKYAAKQTVDTLIYRLGDMLAAAAVYVGTTQLEWSLRAFGLFNVAVISVWLGVAWLLARSYAQQGDEEPTKF